MRMLWVVNIPETPHFLYIFTIFSRFCLLTDKVGICYIISWL